MLKKCRQCRKMENMKCALIWALVLVSDKTELPHEYIKTRHNSAKNFKILLSPKNNENALLYDFFYKCIFGDHNMQKKQ